MSAFFHILLVFFTVYWIPGWLALRWTKTKTTYQTLLATPLGIALWGWQGWIFGWLHVPQGAYIYIGFTCIIFLWMLIKNPSILSQIWESTRILSDDKISTIILILGVASQSLVLWNVLQQTNGTWISCCGDGNDNIWYASITKSIIESFPPQYPGITGQILHNYHYWSNLIIADIVRIFHVDQMLTQFRYTGLLLSFSLGVTLIALSKSLFSKSIFTKWILFLFYFGGDLIYLIPIIQKRIFSFPGSSLEDGIRFLSNPPRSYAIVLALVWITLYTLWRSKIDMKRMGILSILLASTIGFKVYVAFFLLAGVGILMIYDLFNKNYETLKLTIYSLIASALVYFPVNSQAGGLYFVGFWRFENFATQPGFGLIRLEMARMIFYDDHKYWKASVFDALFISIYMLCIFGTKLIGLIPIRKNKYNFPLYLHLFLISGLLTHFLIGSFFQQSTGGSNTFNFHVNVYLFLSLYAALVLTQLHEIYKTHTYIYTLISLIFIVMTIPRAGYELYSHIQRVQNLNPIMTPATQEIISFLHNTPIHSMVAVYARYLASDNNGPYMYLFTNRHQYLSAPALLRQFGADTFDRERNMRVIASSSGYAWPTKKLLTREHIDYLVLDTEIALEATKTSYWLTPVLKTEPVTLMKIDLMKTPPTDSLTPDL